MPLIPCPDCDKQHSDAAPACPNCGRPHLAVPAVASVALPYGQYAQAPVGPRLACPGCGSPDVKKLSLVYEEGNSTVNLSTTGVGFSGGGLGVGVANSTGMSRSLLAQNATPPAKRTNSVGCFFVMALMSLVFGVMAIIAGGDALPAGIVFALLGAGVSYLCFKSQTTVDKWNREEYPKLYHHWNTTFLCTRCSNRFVP
jgi:hypothetical protein